jgi:hypothetical protein
MKLLTKEILEQLPKIGETQDDPDPALVCKFFYPDFSWTWYAIEFDGEDLFYGLVDGFERELGQFSLSELQQNRGKLGCPIERDRYFKPIRLSELAER